jgi:transaldolase/glucose-6-phosphate isomerase
MTLNPQSFSLPFEFSRRVESTLNQWQVEDRVRRLWNGDTSLWTGTDEDRWLGWLGIVEEQQGRLDQLSELSAEVRTAGFTDALLLGMGGSSLCPEVLRSIFGPSAGSPDLSVLDSTDPAQIQAALDRVDLEKTLFVVSSKSGTTLESHSLMEFFFERSSEQVGSSRAGRQWIAITDPGSELESIASDRGFRAVFSGRPEIGGRFSALSDFGMVPAAIMGIDVGRLLEPAASMVRASAADVDAPRNPAIVLGVVLGVAAESNRDKITIVPSPSLASLGPWLEQLLAESTGKGGKALIPVVGEEVGPPESYLDDRVFVYLGLGSDPEPDKAIADIEEAGQPVVRIEIGDVYDLGQEFFRWELAVASAGSFLGLNPFDQPDVDASKAAARSLTAEYERSGKLPQEQPLCETPDIKLFGDPDYTWSPAGLKTGLVEYLRTHLDRIQKHDYFAVLAYVQGNAGLTECLEDIRRTVGTRKRVATTLGFGPRFLHSTGQAHKGGGDNGVFLQVTCDDARDLGIPGHRYSFGTLKAAQAAGDYSVLAGRGRRIVRTHLGPDVAGGLCVLRDSILQALDL